jgi:hypothetical protein
VPRTNFSVSEKVYANGGPKTECITADLLCFVGDEAKQVTLFCGKHPNRTAARQHLAAIQEYLTYADLVNLGHGCVYHALFTPGGEFLIVKL